MDILTKAQSGFKRLFLISTQSFRRLFLNKVSWASGIIFLICAPCFVNAEDKTQISKKTSTQQVGGLLFDVDEGAKIEKGPGGSIYVKSNKEYMQQKFSDMENRLTQLEERTTELENKLKSLAGTENKSEAQSTPAESSGRQVLIS